MITSFFLSKKERIVGKMCLKFIFGLIRSFNFYHSYVSFNYLKANVTKIKAVVDHQILINKSKF